MFFFFVFLESILFFCFFYICSVFSFCSSAEEQDEWLEAISTAISEHTKKTSSFTPGKPRDVVRSLKKSTSPAVAICEQHLTFNIV